MYVYNNTRDSLYRNRKGWLLHLVQALMAYTNQLVHSDVLETAVTYNDCTRETAGTSLVLKGQLVEIHLPIIPDGKVGEAEVPAQPSANNLLLIVDND